MIKNATGNCYWTYKPDDEFRLFFVARRPGREDEALLTFRTFEWDKLLSIAVLIGERQHLWAEWRAIAEQADGHALDKILAPIWPVDYLENVIDVTIRQNRIKSQGVTVSVQLLPTRQVDVIRHVFQTSQLQDAFFGWVRKRDLNSRLALSLVGLLEGKEALAEKMDAIAKAELAFGQKVMNALIEAVEDGHDEAFIP